MLDQAYHFDPDRFADFRVPTLLPGVDHPLGFLQTTDRPPRWWTRPDSGGVILPGQQYSAMDTSPDLSCARCCALGWRNDAGPAVCEPPHRRMSF